MRETIREQFSQRFGGNGVFYASAGRINLIGEHTDYNGGFVFPGAIDKVIMAEIKPNGTDKVRVYSVDIDEYAEFGLNEEDAPTQQWARYIFGVCREVIKRVRYIFIIKIRSCHQHHFCFARVYKTEPECRH